jgi:microsomal epoxide hydrolase
MCRPCELAGDASGRLAKSLESSESAPPVGIVQARKIPVFENIAGSLFKFVTLSVLLSGPSLAATPRRDVMIDVAPDVRIHAIEAGSNRDRPALVLIPGWRLTASIWNEQIDTFAKDRHVIAIDPRSQGQSTKTAEGDTPEQRARDLGKVLDHFSLEGIVLVGWSQGVQDVAAYVNQFGTGRLKGIVLVDSTVSPGAAEITRHPQAASQELGLLSIYAEDPRAYTQGMMRAIIKRALSAEAFDRLVTQALQTPTAIGIAMLASDLFGVDRTPALGKFDRPTLVIASAASEELDAQKAMAAKLPQGHFEVIEKAAHAVFIDQPEQFDALVGQFMQGL